LFRYFFVFFFKQKTAYEMRISDWSSDVCSSDLTRVATAPTRPEEAHMTTYGYFLSSEEHRPDDLVRQAVLAEEAGFEALWISDHFHPWNDEQGQSPFVWSVIGAIANATYPPITTSPTRPPVPIHAALTTHAPATPPLPPPARAPPGTRPRA